MITFYALGQIYLLWVLYLGVMNIKRVHDTVGLNGPSKMLAYPLAIVAIAFDWFCNWTVFAVLFLELPAHKWELVTGRLKRYKTITGWRNVGSKWFALILDAFDPTGRHV